MHNVQKKMRVESTGESENVTLETVAELYIAIEVYAQATLKVKCQFI